MTKITIGMTKTTMRDVQEFLIAAKELIQKTGWCQGQYALKDGKTHYDFSSGQLADSYCLVGAISRVAADFMREDNVTEHEHRTTYYKLSHAATHLVVELQNFTGCPADWNDQDEEARRTQEFMNGLKAKSVPRDKAKPMLAQFKQELKKQNIPPIITKEKVIAAIDYAIGALDC